MMSPEIELRISRTKGRAFNQLLITATYLFLIIIFSLQFFFYTRIHVVLIGFSFWNTFSVSYWCGDFLWTQEMVQL